MSSDDESRMPRNLGTALVEERDDLGHYLRWRIPADTESFSLCGLALGLPRRLRDPILLPLLLDLHLAVRLRALRALVPGLQPGPVRPSAHRVVSDPDAGCGVLERRAAPDEVERAGYLLARRPQALDRGSVNLRDLVGRAARESREDSPVLRRQGAPV